MAKKALKLIVLLVLLAGGVGLLFSKDVGRYIQEWKNRGANEARVSLPLPENTNNLLPDAPGQKRNLPGS